MQVRVLLFGPHAAALGAPSVAIDLDGDRTCGALVERLRLDHPALAPLLAGVRVAVNHTFAEPHRVLDARDEIALIGLVSGG